MCALDHFIHGRDRNAAVQAAGPTVFLCIAPGLLTK
jgi:hypothetical protein